MCRMVRMFVSTAVCVAVLSSVLPDAFSGAVDDAPPVRRQLHVSMYDEPFGPAPAGTLDPLTSHQMLYFNLQHQLFETLVAIDFNTGTVQPLLAEKWERIDEQTLRLYLRHGVRFHNGERFNAATVVFTLDLMRNPRSRFAGRFLFDTIESVTAVDNHTVDIRTRTPDGLLLRKLAALGFMIPPGYYNRVGDAYFARYPMGTGPFRFFYYDESPKGYPTIHFVRNEQYWRGIDFNFDEFVYHCMHPDMQWDALRDGTLDLLISLPSGDRLRGRRAKNVRLSSSLSLRNAVVLFNVDKQGPLTRLAVRQAVLHAVNRQEIISRGLGGHGIPLHAIAPQGALGHCPEPARYREDIRKARTLLAQAGYADGITLRMLVSEGEPSQSVAAVVQRQLARAGITLETVSLSREEIFKTVIEPRLRGGSVPDTFDMWLISSWPSLFGAGTHFYFTFLHSGGIFNFGTYRRADSPIDALYAAAISSDDPDQLCAGLRKIERYLQDHALVVPLYQVEMLYGMRADLRFNPGMNDAPVRFEGCRFIE